MPVDLSGKVAIVTGSCRGPGVGHATERAQQTVGQQLPEERR
jgi:NAD(P)-dependent dehydrogenase (short-subunit alcohol dehydrogenase family)